MSNEVKIGLLAAICIAVTIWGLKFMKGQNILNATNTYYVKYADVDGLTPSSKVLIRGLSVGTVTSVELDTDMQTVVATLDIDNDIKIPATTEALVINLSIMGGKAVELSFDAPCSGDNCAQRGSYLKGRVKGLMESMLGTNDMDGYVDQIKRGIGSIAKAAEDSLMAPGADSEVAKSIQNLAGTLENLELITGKLANSMDAYDRKVLSIMTNLQNLTSDLASQSPQISTAMGNLTTITTDIKNADLGGTLSKSGEVMDKASTAFGTLNSTLEAANKSVVKLEGIMAKLSSQDGTMGKLLNDKALYDNILSTTTNLNLMLQDFRLNPKRYVNVSVFGKKQIDYEVPENDPAFKQE